jgi:feruloyl esterase
MAATVLSVAAWSFATPAAAQSMTPASCAALTGKPIARSAIRLPTRGGTIASAETTRVVGREETFCKVLGRIDPVDPAAPPILFEVNLPERWNGKYIQYGGGGLNGRLVTGLDPIRDAPPGEVQPVAQGYVTAGTDAGHPIARPAIQVFALNDEALTNHAYASYVKTADVAHALMSMAYRRKPTATYFIGGSEGGREGLMFAQRYPAMFDGIVAMVPVINWAGIQLATYDHWQLQRAGGWMDAATVKLWHDTVVEACDGKDGRNDGVLADYAACRPMPALRMRRCANGQAAAGCLSSAQLALIEAVYAPRRYKFPLANGEQSYPGFLPGGEAQPGGVVPSIIDPQKPGPDDRADARYAVGDVRYFITRDPNFSAPLDEMAFRERILQISSLMDMTDPDLRPFFRLGGKLIVKADGADFIHSPAAITRYVDQVAARVGPAMANRSMRVFVAPGTNHGGQGVRGDGLPVPDRVSMLSAIDAWVRGGKAPANLTLTAYDSKGAARTAWPLCRYPLFPRFVGGDGDQAASYRCSPPEMASTPGERR